MNWERLRVCAVTRLVAPYLLSVHDGHIRFSVSRLGIELNHACVIAGTNALVGMTVYAAITSEKR